VGETKEGKGFWFAPTVDSLAVLPRKSAKADQPRLLRMQLQ
jgi:hypothetical protein